MKRFLDKTWTKVVAYFLFFIFTALAVANTAGVVYFFSHEIYLQGETAAREALYYSQADNVADAVQVWLLNSESEEEFIKAVRDRCPAENGYGITVTQPDGKNTTVTALPEDAKIVYTYDRWLDIDGKELVITVSLQEGFLPRTYEYRFGLWLLDMKNALIPLTVLFVVLTLFCFFWQMAAAGHWQGFDGIHLTWFDKIPLDLMAVVFMLPIGFFVGYFNYSSSIAVALWGAAVLNCVFLFLITFVTRCKAGTVLKNNVIWYAIRLLWRILKAIGRWIGHLVRSIPVIWRTALVIAAICLFILIIGSHNSMLSLPMVLLYLLLMMFALYVAIGFATLQRGSKALAEGDYSKPVDTRFLRGDLKRCGENLNKVQQGVQRAVDERLRSERMKTELITNVSHDIKTPLTSIVNYVDLLKKEDIDNPKAQEYLEVLDRQSKRLKKLTEDLVEASKASSGVIPVDCQPTNVNVLLSQLEGEYEERLQKAELTMIVHPAAGDPVVLADGKLLSRVMDNLMNNIGKYAMPGTRVYAAAAADEKESTISIKNVSRNELNVSADELMERFVRGDSSRHTEGSGLGLSIAKSLVELQGGRFELSIDGDLFRADISLPLYRPQ
ncbi:MAG: sensor histidine kinase [Angelakisella sp.]